MYRLDFGHILFVLALGTMIAMGCNRGAGLDTAYVEGIVTLDGEPVPEAEVTFTPVTDGQGMSATGLADATGRYRLTPVGTGAESAQPGSGTLPGEYYVGVRKTIVDTPLSPQEAEEMGVEYEPPTQPYRPQITHIVPERYNSPRRSGLQVTVEEGQNNIPIELTTN